VNKKLLETIRCVDGSPCHLDYHQQRSDASLKVLGCDARYDLASLIRPPDGRLYRCRMIYDATDFSIEYLPYIKRTVQKLRPVHADTLEYALKFADRSAIDRLFACRGDADDILIIQNGLVTDTSIANIAFFDGQRWLTPRNPLLKGTTRARMLDEKEIVEYDIELRDLGKFRHFALLNAMVGFDIVENGIIAPLKAKGL